MYKMVYIYMNLHEGTNVRIKYEKTRRTERAAACPESLMANVLPAIEHNYGYQTIVTIGHILEKTSQL